MNKGEIETFFIYFHIETFLINEIFYTNTIIFFFSNKYFPQEIAYYEFRITREQSA